MTHTTHIHHTSNSDLLLNCITVGIFVLITVLSVAAIWFPSVGRIGVSVWVMSFTILAYAAAKGGFHIIRYIWEQKAVVLGLTLVGFLIVIAYNMPLAKNISGETTQQITCAFEALLNDLTGGFVGECFLGYPNRQYIISTLPTIFFGRSIYTLKIGGMIYFFTGLLLFLGGLVTYFRKTHTGEYIGVFALASLMQVYFFGHFLFYAEQSLYPTAWALALGGLYFYFLKQKHAYYVALIGIVLVHMVYSYTPSIAVIALAMGIMCWSIPSMKKTSTGRLIIGIVIAVALLFILSLKNRQDIILVSTKDRSWELLFSDIKESISHILDSKTHQQFMAPVFRIPFLVLLFLMFWSLQWPYVAVGVWIVCTIFFAIVARGYAYYSVDYRLFRAIGIFPVFFTSAALFVRSSIQKIPRIPALVLLSLYVGIGLTYFAGVPTIRPDNPHYILGSVLSPYVQPDVDTYVYLVGDAKKTFVSYVDVGKYFTPHITTNLVESDSCMKDVENGGIVLYVSNDEDICQKQIASPSIRKGKYQFLETFTIGTQSFKLVKKL